MKPMAFEKVCSLDDLWEGDMKEFVVNGRKVLVVHSEGGQIAGFAALCPHQAFPLVQGKLEGATLICSAHMWEFDAATGVGVNPTECSLRRYETKVEDGHVYLDPSKVLKVAAA
jgi:toluene monooxygenase system ferredoxin subunit